MGLKRQREAVATMARILVVDDHHHIQQLVGFHLAKAGHEVEMAGDGVVGLQKVVSFSPEIILLDWVMPNMSGMEMMERLQADDAHRQIPVVFLTAKSRDADVAEGWSSGASWYLTKPFNPADLLSVVARVLEASREGGDESGHTSEA
jgi:DNA-binding response OmpR family regulator